MFKTDHVHNRPPSLQTCFIQTTFTIDHHHNRPRSKPTKIITDHIHNRPVRNRPNS